VPPRTSSSGMFRRLDHQDSGSFSQDGAAPASIERAAGALAFDLLAKNAGRPKCGDDLGMKRTLSTSGHDHIEKTEGDLLECLADGARSRYTPGGKVEYGSTHSM